MYVHEMKLIDKKKSYKMNYKVVLFLVDPQLRKARSK